ncbi:MAG: IS481 family transposase [Thermoanaerobaculia bacterium]|nr:IS481 family transposase [Thermoanaerobaculia bacterium]
MDIHKNARSCPASRELLVRRVLERGWSVPEAAQAFGLSKRTAYKWLQRYKSEGLGGLADRSSRPRRSPGRTPRARRRRVVELRRQRMSGAEIAARLRMSPSTVARILKREGLSRLRSLEPTEPPRRYEKQDPGELLHLDIKKLGKIRGIGHRITGKRQHCNRGIGWEYVHVAIDDASRLAYAEMLPDERQESAIAFLERAVAFYAGHGVRIQRLLTDNGSCYRAHAFTRLCRQLDIRHSFTRPYRPRTNGKAERLIQTLLREWAYRFAYHSSIERRRCLTRYLHFYNWHRQHQSLRRQPPASRLPLPVNNVLRIHT